jgi:rhomboid family GlyGly-CTERM serine protease
MRGSGHYTGRPQAHCTKCATHSHRIANDITNMKPDSPMLQRMVLRPLLTAFAIMAAVVGLIQTAGAGAFHALAYERDAVLAGEVWRLATGPWVHLSWAHAALNLGGLALVLMMFAPLVQPRAQALGLVVIGTLTSALLALFGASVAWMVGLSGPLHGLFAADALALATRRDPTPAHTWWRGPRYGWVLLGGLALKLALEALTQPHKQAGPPGWLGGPVLIEAHWAGTIAGLIVCVAWRALSHQRSVATQAPRTERE